MTKIKCKHCGDIIESDDSVKTIMVSELVDIINTVNNLGSDTSE